MVNTRFALGVLGIIAATWGAEGQELERLRYQNPDLVVDLGVGLWAWPIPADADGDGDFDLVVSCPDKPSNGVWFFENASGPTREQKFPVFKPARKLSGTVHYVMPSYVDGRVRVLSPDTEYADFFQVGLKHPTKWKVPQPIHVPSGNAKGTRRTGIRHNQWRLADYDGDGAVDLIVGIEDWSDYGWDDAYDASGRWTNGPLHGLVYLLRNEGTTESPKYARPTLVEAAGGPVDTYGCPSPNFADFDGDGDLDLLCGEFVDGFTYFPNTGSRTVPKYGAPIRLTTESGEKLAMNVQMIVPIGFDWDEDGDLDLVVGDEDGRVALVENTGKRSAEGMPYFLPPRYFQQEADELKCGALATPVGVDWDGDGDTDIVSGNTSGVIEIFLNESGPKVARPRWSAPTKLMVGDAPFRVMAGQNGGIQGPCEEKWGYTTLSVADWDGDGDLDVVHNSILGRVGWLENIGTRTEPKFAENKPVVVAWDGPPPKPAWTWWTPGPTELATQWRTTPVAYDFTGDGLMDLAMLDHEGYLALFEREKRSKADGTGTELVLLPGRRIFTDEKGKPLHLNDKRGGGSGRRKFCVTDWNGDGRFDLLLNSTSANVLVQVDGKEGTFAFRDMGPLSKRNIEGHDVSPTVVDFDGDGIATFLGGAEDGGLYLLDRPASDVKKP